MEAALASLRVVCRAHAPVDGQTDGVELNADENTVAVFRPKADHGAVNNRSERWSFTFDRVLPVRTPAALPEPSTEGDSIPVPDDAGQTEIFEEAVLPVLRSFVGGVNGAVLAYGGVGSGKTHTICGSTTEYRLRGSVPRALEFMFKTVEEHAHDRELVVEVSFMELYCETIRDLLVGGRSPAGKPPLRVEEVDGSTRVRGLTIAKPSSLGEAMETFFAGLARRTTANRDNHASNRGHCIFTLYLRSQSRRDSTAETVLSKIHFVDLAAPERGESSTDDSTRRRDDKQTQIQRRETGHNNRSLAFLEQVIVGLSTEARRTLAQHFSRKAASDTAQHVPFRSSVLTNVLKDSLGSEHRCVLIANILGTPDVLSETIATLRFAARMSEAKVVGKEKVNTHETQDQQIARLQHEIQALRAELRMHDALVGAASSNQWEPYSEAQKRGFRELIEAYCDGTTELEISSLRQVRELLSQFRSLVAESKRPQSVPDVQGEGKSAKAAPAEPVAPSAALPSPSAATTAASEVTADDSQPADDLPSRSDAFRLFLDDDPGANLKELLEERSRDAEVKREELMGVAERLNEASRAIGELRGQVDRKKHESRVQSRFAQLLDSGDGETDGVRVMDEEEFTIRSKLDEVKTQYRDLHETLPALEEQLRKAESELNSTIDDCLGSFAAWSADKYGQSFAAPDRADQYLFGSEPQPVDNGTERDDEEAAQPDAPKKSETAIRRQPDFDVPEAALFYRAVAQARTQARPTRRAF
jgi:kinesin family member 6/9